MPRPSLAREKRAELIPLVARAFAELGYRRTTTATLAHRCDVRENVLYRLWPDKKAMFIAAIEYVYQLSERTWNHLLTAGDDHPGAERLLDYESRHHGEFGHYRIVFAGLSETDDPEIRAALRRMYQRFHRFLSARIAAYRANARRSLPAADLSAWAVIGLGTVANIGRELGVLPQTQRRQLFTRLGRLLLEGRA